MLQTAKEKKEQQMFSSEHIMPSCDQVVFVIKPNVTNIQIGEQYLSHFIVASFKAKKRSCPVEIGFKNIYEHSKMFFNI